MEIPFGEVYFSRVWEWLSEVIYFKMFKVSVISKSIFLSILLFVLFSCNSIIGKKPKYYYIIEQPDLETKRTIENGDTFYLPPPPRLFYGNFNFILFDAEKILYHNKKGPFYFCGRGVDFSRPEKLDLNPRDFTEIKLADLEKFLNDSIRADTLKNGGRASVKISSPKDTIYNPAINIILDHIKKKGIIRWSVITSTEEERCVINSILEMKPYDSKNCDFKVGFGGEPLPPPIQSDSTK